MKSKKFNILLVTGAALSMIVMVGGLIFAGSGAKLRIGGYSLRANGQVAKNFVYTGSCPVQLKFGWCVMSSEPTKVTYTFKRSDGGTDPVSTIDIPKANKCVEIYYDWQIGAKEPMFKNYKGSVELVIQSPHKVIQKISFTLHCK